MVDSSKLSGRSRSKGRRETEGGRERRKEGRKGDSRRMVRGKDIATGWTFLHLLANDEMPCA